MSALIRIVEDDQDARASLRRLLLTRGYKVRDYASAGDFLLKEDDTPGCALLDVHMPGPSGLDLQEAIAKQTHPLPVIFVTNDADVATIVRAIKAGAIDFFTKPLNREALLTAIEIAIARDQENRTIRAQRYAWRRFYSGLSVREQEVFDGVVSGKLNKQIAMQVGVAERTVKAYRASVMKKMNANSVAELVSIASELRLTASMY